MNIFDKREAKYREVARLRDALERATAEAREYDTLIELAEKHNVELRTAAEAVNAVVAQVAVRRAEASSKTQKQRVIEAAEAVLSDGVRRLSRELYREVGKLGVSIGSKDPVGTLCVYLSREKDKFTSNVKAGGWTLCKLQKKARPEDVAASQASLLTAH